MALPKPVGSRRPGIWNKIKTKFVESWKKRAERRVAVKEARIEYDPHSIADNIEKRLLFLKRREGELNTASQDGRGKSREQMQYIREEIESIQKEREGHIRSLAAVHREMELRKHR